MEEVAGTFEAVGAEGKASLAAEQTDQFEQTQAVLQSVIEQFNAVYAQAESLKTAGGGSAPTVTVGSDGEFTISGEIPRDQWRNEVGDRIEDPGEAEGAADRVNMGKLRQAGRGFVRNADRAHGRGKDAGDTAGYIVQSNYNPLQGAQSHTTADTRPPPSATGPTSPDINMGDAIGSTIIVAAVVIEGVGRFADWRRRRKSERGENNGT